MTKSPQAESSISRPFGPPQHGQIMANFAAELEAVCTYKTRIRPSVLTTTRSAIRWKFERTVTRACALQIRLRRRHGRTSPEHRAQPAFDPCQTLNDRSFDDSLCSAALSACARNRPVRHGEGMWLPSCWVKNGRQPFLSVPCRCTV